ncbi:MAG: asparagine synthetase B, partial [Geobacteraceae bacterium]
MCGILGIMGRIDTDLARRCLATIRHRGPDGEGLWQDNGVTLGHRRLAILDTSEAGRQPMSYANQRYWITFNGEIYNFIEIRAELEGKGHRFGTGTDTEVLLAAFVEWG